MPFPHGILSTPMCGIFGYVGPRDPVPIIMGGFASLEYRGYDSAGIAVVEDSKLQVRRRSGKAQESRRPAHQAAADRSISVSAIRAGPRMAGLLKKTPIRIATAKAALSSRTTASSRTTFARSGNLIEEGHKFTTETDTEVIAHLIEKYFDGNLEDAVVKTLAQLKGLFAFICMSADDPQKIVAVREGNPLDRRGGRWRGFRRFGCSRQCFPIRARFCFSMTTKSPSLLATASGCWTPPATAAKAAVPAHHLGSDHGGKGRLQAFHAQGNL